MTNRMDRSFVIIRAVAMLFFYTGIADFDSSNGGVSNSATLMENNNIVIETLHDYLQGQEKRLANLRKHIEDYSKAHETSIRQMAKPLSATTQETLFSDDGEIKKDTDDDGDVLTPDDRIKFKKLCNGEILLPTRIQRKLKCRYVDHAIPFLKIAPFKEEEAYLDPRIVIYHDVLYEEEIDSFKRLSKPKLQPAGTRNATTGRGQVSKVRIAKSAGLTDYDTKYVTVLDRRVEHMTGLTVDTAEALHIAYYDVGGYYLQHFDFSGTRGPENMKTWDGDRIATVLFYMNDVARGGGTTFPNLNFTIWPKKGSAVFWNNLKRNGEGDKLSLHAACPVLSGPKWIATQWLNVIGQEFRRPCTLLENE